MLVQLAEGIMWPSCSSTGASRPDPGAGSARARRARGRGRQHEPAAGILGATIKLASLPAAFAALYRAHDISPDLASALLDMNSAAFVSNTGALGPAARRRGPRHASNPGAAAPVRLLRDRHRRSKLRASRASP